MIHFYSCFFDLEKAGDVESSSPLIISGITNKLLKSKNLNFTLLYYINKGTNIWVWDCLWSLENARFKNNTFNRKKGTIKEKRAFTI